MTSAPVTDMANSYTAISPNKAVQKQSSAETQTDSFSKVMDQAKNSNVSGNHEKNDTQVKNTKKTDAEKTETANSENKTDKTDEKSDVTQKENTVEQEKQPEDLEEQKQAVRDTAMEILNLIAEQMNVSVSDIETALKNLQMNPEDLLQIGDLKDLLVSMTEGADVSNVLTDSNLYQMMQDITTTVQNLVSELEQNYSLEDGELGQLLQQMTEVVPEGTSDLTFTVPEEQITEAVEEQKPVLLQKEPEMVTQKESPEQSLNVTETVIKTTADNGQVTNEATGQNASGEEQTNGQQNSSVNGFVEQLISQTESVLSEITTDSLQSMQDINAQDVIDQITEYMKVQLGRGESSVELQLHPASLGTLNVQVAAKDGSVTAQFTAQNEAVKNVIENQMVQLKNQLEEAGVKIEAVEVTVASHEFESNLQQNNQQNGETERESKKKGIRRIDLANIDSLFAEEDADEADVLAADIMRQNGNQVDYLA
ncbi:MAG: flagellar hook-length control protein FliK [Lachnospiraceae bacterium]|nr:flagellar hook-length control protein FliK [Lachnospiraceae bacterium]